MAIETIESWWVWWVFHGVLQEMLNLYGSFQLCYAMFDKLPEGTILGSKFEAWRSHRTLYTTIELHIELKNLFCPSVGSRRNLTSQLFHGFAAELLFHAIH